jgi:hypothetical protein
MPFPSNVQITAPPGLFRNGTLYQSKGRWHDGNLVRFQQDQIKPVGGWQSHSGAAAFVGKARAITTWRDLAGNNWIAVGTSSKLYAESLDGVSHDITPAGLAVGRDDATQNLGYGGGTYGRTFYGVPPTSTVSFLPATVWTLDAWGQNLVGCNDTDGKLYQWTLGVSTPAALVAPAPTGNTSLVVTQEGILMLLGSGGDGRRIAWCDQQDITDWTPTTANQAGDFELSSAGSLRGGIVVRGGTLLFTDTGLWMANYIGSPLVYGFQKVGEGCGIISIGAKAAHDSMAVWMGKNGAFWMFDGQAVQPLDCDVLDLINDLNVNQASKISAMHLADQGEVWWLYPSSASVEVDSYVCWSYRESQRQQRNIWTFGQLNRTCGENRGVFTYPMMVDTGGLLWEHEVGTSWGGATPYLETGPFELGNGDYMAEVQRVVPDQLTNGQLSATFYLRMWPNGPETTVAATPLISPTDLLFQATEVRARFSGLGDWRLGNVRLDLIQGDLADSAPPPP